MYKINFNHLYYFLTIAKEGSIVKASKVLHITQPALSHQLKTLEQDLGKKLFDRKGKRLQINSEGELVRGYASKIFRHAEEMIHVLKTDSEKMVKIVKVGHIPWISKSQTYQFLKPVLANPHIKVVVIQKDLDALLKDILADRLDIILCDSPYSGRSKKLQGRLIEVDPIICVAKPKSRPRGRFPQCLEGQKIVTYSEACLMTDKIDDFIQTQKLNVRIIGSFSDSSLMKITIEKSGAIGFLPLSVAKESLKNKTLVKLGSLNKVSFSTWVITQKAVTKEDGVLASLVNIKS